MNQKQWNLLEKVNEYLISRTSLAVQGFKELDQLAKEDKAELVIISFTYEHLEAVGKVNGAFKLYNSLFDVLSNDQLAGLLKYEYNEDNAWEDYQYWKLHSLSTDLVEMWMAQCFEQASIYDESGISYFFKQTHDSMDILELGANQGRLEQSEFEQHYSLNKDRTLNLIN